jgi:cell division protein FtsQ
MILKKKYIITFITLLIILIIIKTNNSENLYFPIKNVTSSELINVNKDDISEAVKYLYSKSFFDIDLNYLKNKLEKIEWVRKINVRRSYPNEIIIDIEEHTPILIWNNKMYINKYGEKFIVSKIDKNIPILVSDESRINEVFTYFESFNDKLSSRKLDFKITKIVENEIRSLTISLSSGINIQLGSKDVNNKITLFFEIYKSLNTRDLKKIRYIDMRYSNGFSVGWN